MASSFGFSLIRSGFVILSFGRRENSSEACIDLLSERVDFVCTSVFTHMLLLSISLCYTHPHTAVIVRFDGILEGSSFCGFITASGIASSVADSQLQGPQFHPDLRLLSI